MKAIRTRYYPATNTRGARIVADDGDGNKVSISAYHDTLEGIPLARHAAEELARKMRWRYGGLIGGGYADDIYWCFLESDY
jgi:hypothetical protein